ncbi:MAG: pyruvate kinase [Oscillospiraceae bacterium]|nr:pyruvate kinase [Oscillospiraceae bacterium]
MRKTKIICTLGPSTDNTETLRQLMVKGMNVARFNFSHQTHQDHKKRFDAVVALREELNLPIGTLLDTKGPEIRLKQFKDGKVFLETGSDFILTTEDVLGTEKISSITYKDLPEDINKDTRILIDDGLIELKVKSFDNKNIICEVINGGCVSNNKGVNVPGVKLSLPYISKKDEEDIAFGVRTGFDFIAASFTRSAEDVMQVRKILNKNNCKSIKIIAKIENADGVNNIDEIIQSADGVMIARGDMGVEIPYETLPVLQKMIIKKSYNAGKQVITATQMLDSMMKNPRPTRAEATDVANAIYDGTSAIMLSGETAAGMYPVESLTAMANIAKKAEKDIDYVKRFNTRDINGSISVTNAISHATVTTAHDLKAKSIITVTKSGKTARMISKYRPLAPIISCSSIATVCRQLNLSWGVTPVIVDEKDNTDTLFDHSVRRAVDEGLVASGDLVVITAGVPLGVPGTTNLLKVHIVGDILISGTGITNNKTCENLCICQNEKEALENFKNGDILVIPETTNNILHLIKSASGIIVESESESCHAATVGLALDIPVLIGCKNATKILKNGITVTLDAARGVVCSNTLLDK